MGMGLRKVACKQMGFTGSSEAPVPTTCRNPSSGDHCASEPPSLSELACDGSETDVLSCAFEEGSDVFCAPAESVVIQCLGNGDTQGKPLNGVASRVGTARSLPGRSVPSFDSALNQ